MAQASLHNLAQQQQQQQQQQQIWQAILSTSTSTAAAVGPAALASLEQLLLAQGATASFLQAAALASSIAVADQVPQNSANGLVGVSSLAALASQPASDEDAALEQVSSYTVQEPSSESLSESSGSQTAMDEEQLEFLCELLSDSSSDGGGMRTSSPPVQVAWNGASDGQLQQQQPPTSWSGLALSPPSATDAAAAAQLDSASLLASPRSDLSAADMSLELFLSAFDAGGSSVMAPSSPVQPSLNQQLQHLRFSPASSPSPSLSTQSLEHAASIDDILTAQSSPRQATTSAIIPGDERSADAAPAFSGHARLAPRSTTTTRGAKRSPRLSAARRTLSAPSYKVTLPDSGSGDDTGPSNSSSSDNGGHGNARDDATGEEDAKRPRGPRSKKRRAASDTTGAKTTPAAGAAGAPPRDKDSHRYRRRRDQNNEAVRRCRQRNKDKYEESVRHSAVLQAENSALKQRLTSMELDMASLRQRLSSTQLDGSSPVPTRKYAAASLSHGSGGSSGDDESSTQAAPGAAHVTLWDMFVDMTGEL